jgi:hypothetical protein
MPKNYTPFRRRPRTVKVFAGETHVPVSCLKHEVKLIALIDGAIVASGRGFWVSSPWAARYAAEVRGSRERGRA